MMVLVKIFGGVILLVAIVGVLIACFGTDYGK